MEELVFVELFLGVLPRFLDALFDGVLLCETVPLVDETAALDDWLLLLAPGSGPNCAAS